MLYDVRKPPGTVLFPRPHPRPVSEVSRSGLGRRGGEFAFLDVLLADAYFAGVEATGGGAMT